MVESASCTWVVGSLGVGEEFRLIAGATELTPPAGAVVAWDATGAGFSELDPGRVVSLLMVSRFSTGSVWATGKFVPAVVRVEVVVTSPFGLIPPPPASPSK
jgi:hypothetical protein